MEINYSDVIVPFSVPNSKRDEYIKNYLKITNNSGRLMLFAGDQKIEHLNKDFYGKGISVDDSNPKHFFEIAQNANIGVFATQLGLISRYAPSFPDIPYLVKINSKTNLVKTKQKDPYSSTLCDIEDVMFLKNEHNLNILGIGYTIFLGSEYEAEMFEEVSRLIIDAHKQGLICVIWIYPRGKGVTDEKDSDIIAGACGVALCLGADFVKVNYPKINGKSVPEKFKQAINAAGRCGVVCAGGSKTSPKEFFDELYEQIHVCGVRGNATGRNVHQRDLKTAIRMCNAIYSITVLDYTPEHALKIYNGDEEL